MPHIDVRTGARLHYEITGSGEPLLLIMGTSGAVPLWGEFRTLLEQRFQVIAFDNRGMGGSDRGEGPMSVSGLASDASALLEALDIPRAHVLGWSLGSAIAQEMALARPEQIASLTLYATWAKADGQQRALMGALRYPYAQGDLKAAMGGTALVYSPEMLDRPNLREVMAPYQAGLPSTDLHIRTTVEQWDADLAFDSSERIHAITAPTLVVVGEQDLLTPPRQAQKVADTIPSARFELLTGPGSSHAMHIERPQDLAAVVLRFLHDVDG